MNTAEAVVVIGAGLAGAMAVDSLREEGFDGSIALIGSEPDRPYERPPLSKEYLLGKAERDKAFVHPASWYRENRVDTHFSDAAVAIDRTARVVKLASGIELPYTALLLATGARPRTLQIPGSDLSGIMTLREFGDSDRLREAFARQPTVVVVGAGWIGLEVAAAARLAGADVTVLEYAEVPLSRVLGGELGNYFADLHRAHGVTVRTGVGVTGFRGEAGRVTGVEAGDEVVPADLVIVGVGAAPNTELASDANLAVDNGVLVDARLRTSDPAIWAAGDVANAENTLLGEHLRVEHWDNAIRQGRLAARTILGREGSYDWQPYFYTDQYDLGMEYVGRGGADDEVVIRGDKASGEFIVFWLRDGAVSAAMNVNIWDVNDELRALIGKTVDPVELADPGIELTDL